MTTLVAALGGSQAPASFRVLPAGAFRATDGRPSTLPSWQIDRGTAAQLITSTAARAEDTLIDYEHQSLNPTRPGPAPAAGWFKRLEWREGDGLYVTDARWTDQARTMIEAGEYRYLSPTFTYDANNGKVTRLVSVALTNMPALNGLADLAAATEQLGIEPEPDLELARTAERFNHAFAHLGVQYSADEIATAKHNAVDSPGEPFANDPVGRGRFEWAFPGILK